MKYPDVDIKINYPKKQIIADAPFDYIWLRQHLPLITFYIDYICLRQHLPLMTFYNNHIWLRQHLPLVNISH